MSMLRAALMGIVLVFIKKQLCWETWEMVCWFIFELSVMFMVENKMLLAAKEGHELLFIPLLTCCHLSI